MGKKFNIGIVVDVVPIKILSKGWEYFEVPASMHGSSLLSENEIQKRPWRLALLVRSKKAVFPFFKRDFAAVFR